MPCPGTEAANPEDDSLGRDPLKDYSIYKQTNGYKMNPWPANAVMQPTRYARFDGLLLEYTLRLVFIARTFFTPIFSPRSQGNGICTAQIEPAIIALQRWKNGLPREVQWDTHCQPLLNKVTTSASSYVNIDTAKRNAIMSLLMEYMYHGLIKCMWESIIKFGLRDKQDMTEVNALMMCRMGLGNKKKNETASLLDPEEVKRNINELMDISFLRISRISQEAQRLGFLRCSRISFLTTTREFVYFGIKKDQN